MEKEKYIGEALLKSKPKRKLTFNLSSIGLEKAAQAGYERVKPFIDDLQNQIDAVSSTGGGGVAFSNMFGNNTHIGVSQKALTDAFNLVWRKLEDITGEPLCGFDMIVTPDYFFGDDGCDVHITATTVGLAGKFDWLKLYINEEEVINEQVPTDYIEVDTQIEDTSVVRCEAQILGNVYTRQRIIYRYTEFWLFAATDAQLGEELANISEFMTAANRISVDKSMRSAKDLRVATNQHIVMVMAEGMRSSWYRADINGVEIPMTEHDVTIGEGEEARNYKVMVSEDTYVSGTYNVDING